MIRQPDFPNFFSRRGVVAEIGVLAYHVNDIAVAIGSAISRQVSVSDQDRDEVLRWVEKHQTRKERLSPLFGAARGRNLILISAESLNAFPLGLTLRGQRITPHLDKLAAESLHFTNFFDQAHLGTTSDGETLALESLYPLPDGPVATRFPTNDFLGLPTILSRHSYHTLSAVAATAETWNMGQMHPRHGIMRSYFERDFVASERVNGWIADHVFFQQILPLLKKQPQPFMAFLLSGSSHFPYELPASLRTLPVGQLEGTLLGRYLQAVHYFDGAIGQFVQGLRDSGLLEQSVVAIYGDHHGYLDDPAAIARLLGATPDDILSRWRSRKLVPFLVRLPRGEAAGTRTVTGGHLDIAPTLLALLGIDMAGTAMLGLDLTLGEEQLVVFRDGSFVNSQGYYLNQPGFPICFDSTGTGVDCGAFSASRREALERLRVSDAMIHGNLISHFLQFTENDR